MRHCEAAIHNARALERQRAQPRLYVLRDSELVNIQRPVLVLWGDRDTRYQPIAAGQSKAALIPGSRFEVVAGGHEPWLDDPDGCAEVITDFLASPAMAADVP